MKYTSALVFLYAACCASQAFAITGNLLHTFNDPTVTVNDFFGYSVAVEGNHVLIGALADDTNGNNVGQAHLFDIIVPEPATGCLLLGMSLIAGACRRR